MPPCGLVVVSQSCMVSAGDREGVGCPYGTKNRAFFRKFLRNQKMTKIPMYCWTFVGLAVL